MPPPSVTPPHRRDDRDAATVFPAAMETIHAGYWKIPSGAAITTMGKVSSTFAFGSYLCICHEMSNGLLSLEHIQQRDKQPRRQFI
jgi:hypothetical protein